MDHKCTTIRVVNKSLSTEDFTQIKQRLRNYDKGFEEDNCINFLGISTTKTQYSIDYGAIVTEYDAFRLALQFYIGEFIHGVEIL
jgi:hypothetical protein